jgi:hypothetical protein
VSTVRSRSWSGPCTLTPQFTGLGSLAPFWATLSSTSNGSCDDSPPDSCLFWGALSDRRTHKVGRGEADGRPDHRHAQGVAHFAVQGPRF